MKFALILNIILSTSVFLSGLLACGIDAQAALTDALTQKWRLYDGALDGWYVDTARKAPAVGPDGTVYVVRTSWRYVGYSSKEEIIKLTAVNPATGGVMWEEPVSPTITYAYQSQKLYYSSPAVAADGTIYVGSANAKLYAFYPNGVKKWDLVLSGPIEATPSIGPDGTIYAATHGELSIYDPSTGSLHAVTPSGVERWVCPLDAGVTGQPVVDGNGAVYVAAKPTGKIHSVNAANGSKNWTVNAADHVASYRIDYSPALSSDGALYVSAKGGLLAIDSGGGVNWVAKEYLNSNNTITSYSVESSPAIGLNGDIYFVNAGRMTRIDKQDGQWIAESPWPFMGYAGQLYDVSPAIASDGTIIFAHAGGISAFPPNLSQNLKKFNSSAGYPATIGPDGVIYICYNYLIAFTGMFTGPGDSAWAMHGRDSRHSGALPVLSAPGGPRSWKMLPAIHLLLSRRP